MAIRYFCDSLWRRAAVKPIVVYNNGRWEFSTQRPRRFGVPEFLCDTADEAEKLRLLIEQRREEREALEREWELRLAEEVSR